ncbi:hypothetical protein AYO21_10691 [Fonsecaea monophora]|uniref:Acyltransferase MbtK/IucB-like conserved domain-containing protein n=1 Tax=Fonsecaea monophora TaxID=254056 RepID=A0A177ESZ4_9EURO|nr:hypothetical protein AYO21_10691 [Fonsecaea monophora]KAH0835266.1 acetylase [Fonsecaea pedrosoi]OAG35124.1 hypothetical protein AYO21_10691 [Fonsecaea monophora]
MSTSSQSSQSLPPVRLPEPWKTSYEIQQTVSPDFHGDPTFKLVLSETQLPDSQPPPEPLHHDGLTYSDTFVVRSGSEPTEAGDNSPWARFHASAISYVSWTTRAQPPTVGQIWLLIHALLTQHPDHERFRLQLTGNGHAQLSQELLATGIATPSPKPSRPGHEHPTTPSTGTVTVAVTTTQVSVSRSAFWQGAASPFGTRPVWVSHPALYSQFSKPVTSAYPAFPLEHTVTFTLDPRPVHAQHPIRPPKPTRGAVIYSRYVPDLDEFFAMDHLDWRDDAHLALFHKWQNDPRVSQGWNETGTLEQHREYLRKMDEDPHQMAVLARFNDVYFAYFEIYWAKEDHMGVYISPAPGDFDRGRHSLVGDVQYRGPHRASVWWTSLIHYLFLDDPRTVTIVGEPKFTNANVLRYDMANGFHLHKLADLPHKRSAIVRCERVRFFQVADFASTGAGSNAIAGARGEKGTSSAGVKGASPSTKKAKL